MTDPDDSYLVMRGIKRTMTDPDDRVGLKPCPFCGVAPWKNVLGVVRCSGEHEGHHPTIAMPVETWNTRALSERVAAKDAEIARINQGMTDARETFLGMIADADRYEAEYDGDETGGRMSYHLHVGTGFEELAEALGVKPPGYMEGWPDAIDRAVAAPAALTKGQVDE